MCYIWAQRGSSGLGASRHSFDNDFIGEWVSWTSEELCLYLKVGYNPKSTGIKVQKAGLRGFGPGLVLVPYDTLYFII